MEKQLPPVVQSELVNTLAEFKAELINRARIVRDQVHSDDVLFKRHLVQGHVRLWLIRVVDEISSKWIDVGLDALGFENQMTRIVVGVLQEALAVYRDCCNIIGDPEEVLREPEGLSGVLDETGSLLRKHSPSDEAIAFFFRAAACFEQHPQVTGVFSRAGRLDIGSAVEPEPWGEENSSVPTDADYEASELSSYTFEAGLLALVVSQGRDWCHRNNARLLQLTGLKEVSLNLAPHLFTSICLRMSANDPPPVQVAPAALGSNRSEGKCALTADSTKEHLPKAACSPVAAKRMVEYFESRGISQTEFAGRVGTTDRTLRRFRRTGRIRREILEAIATAMGTTIEQLMKPE